MMQIKVNIGSQQMMVYQHDKLIHQYLISTGKNGVGELNGSGKTPRGWHIIRAKIGEGMPVNTVFKERRPTGEIFVPELKIQFPERDWILTRIFWLSGLETGKNRLGNVDTMRRFIYIHGSPDDVVMGIPGSKGCIRMRNADLLALFKIVPVGVKLLIEE